MAYSINNLLNSGSKNMNVNGASVNQVFTYSPGGSSSVVIEGITCLLRDEGTTSLSKFGAISSLTNGVLMEFNISGVTTALANIKDNADLCSSFHWSYFGNGAVLSILAVTTPVGFLDSANVFIGHINFDNPVILTGSDSITVTIRDNISNIDLLQMSCKSRID